RQPQAAQWFANHEHRAADGHIGCSYVAHFAGGTAGIDRRRSSNRARHMKRFGAVAVMVTAMLLPLHAAHADDSKTFDFCGGTYTGYTGFAFCASVAVAVAPATEA